MRITVLGGAGKMACISVQDLAQDPRVDEVVIADLNLEQAKIVADYIKSPKIKVRQVDVNDPEGMVEALKGSDTCLNGTVYNTNLPVMKAMPPLTDDPNFTYAVPTIVEELIVDPMIFRNGEFKAAEPLSEFEDYWFTQPIGLLPIHLSLHSEVATLPVSFKDKGVQECFFKINYWGMAKAVVEKIRVMIDFGFGSTEPVEVDGNSIVPRDFLVSMLGGYVPPITDFLAPAKTEPPDWAKEIVTEVHGTKDGQEITYRMGTLTCKGALPTGVAPAIAAVWLAEGRVKPGVYPPELALDPLPFFKELEERKIFTQVTKTHML
jgi:saccharopine dehydrogenase-like NADP-dependent oxidoreductase